MMPTHFGRLTAYHCSQVKDRIRVLDEIRNLKDEVQALNTSRIALQRQVQSEALRADNKAALMAW